MDENAESKRELFVIGHRNPDTDSICAAIGTAEFLRSHGEPNAKAARCGEIPLRAAWVLAQAGVEDPVLIHDVTPTAGSICQRHVIKVSPEDTFLKAYQLMSEKGMQTIPVVDSEQNLCGLLRYFDLLNLLMPFSMDAMEVRSVYSSLKNIAETIDGKCLTGEALSEEENRNILLVGASSDPSVRTRLANYKAKGMAEDLVVICGDRPNVQLCAIEAGVRALVTTSNASPSQDIIETAQSKGTCILCTKWDTASVGQLIRCSRKVQGHKDFTTFSESMPLAKLKQTVVRSRQDLFPVMSDRTGKLVGVLSKRDLVDPPRTRLALVDHNEFAQAVKGVEEAEIVEVTDHHRLGTQLSTSEPIRFLIEPVGSSSTLVAKRFYHRDEVPSRATAICLCAGILSDTINLTSPTSTRSDKAMLEWLTGIAEIDAEKFTEEFFEKGSLLRSKTPPSSMVLADRKLFTEDTCKISISQIEEVGIYGLDNIRDDLIRELEKLCKAENLDLACLLVTDVEAHDSVLLATGDCGILDHIEYERLSTHVFSAKGVTSRKKQLFPVISHAIKNL